MPSTPPAIVSARGCCTSCLTTCSLNVDSARHARHDDRDGRRRQQRRNLRDEAVADRQQRVDAAGLGDRHTVIERADDEPPMTLMTRIKMPATASPRTNLLAPSIAP